MHCAGCGELTEHTQTTWWIKRMIDAGMSGTAIQIESAGRTNYPWCVDCNERETTEL